MITDFFGNPRYADKPYEPHVRPPSPQLKALYREMEMNPNYHISREQNFYPKGFPSVSPGWGLG